MRIRKVVYFVLVARLFVACWGPASAQESNTAAAKGKNVVLWVSVDGCRGDYVDRGQSPFLASLMQHGAYTKQLKPIFPSLTFPSHVSEVTGAPAGIHGIVSNKWYDMSTGQEYNLPGEANLLQAEPIWLTASRQKVRAAVMDWPLSGGQDKLPPDSPRAAFFNERYDSNLTDEERLEKVVEAYRADSANPKTTEPLQLLMGYVHDVDSAGHKFRPDAPETTKALHQIDQLLEKVVNEVAEIFKQRMHGERGDALYVLITTDHGMDDVKTLVNARRLIGGAEVPNMVRIETAGSLANVYLNDVPGPQRQRVKQQIIEQLRAAPFAPFWLREDLPADWNYGNPTRTGDIVINMLPGFDFTTRHEDAVTTPAATDPKALKGMHGYDPGQDPKMLGFTVLCRYGSDAPGADLGCVDSLQIHPTVAKLLGIEPAAGAKATAISPLP